MQCIIKLCRWYRYSQLIQYLSFDGIRSTPRRMSYDPTVLVRKVRNLLRKYSCNMRTVLHCYIVSRITFGLEFSQLIILIIIIMLDVLIAIIFLQGFDQLTLNSSFQSVFQCQLRLFSQWFDSWTCVHRNKLLYNLHLKDPSFVERFHYWVNIKS